MSISFCCGRLPVNVNVITNQCVCLCACFVCRKSTTIHHVDVLLWGRMPTNGQHHICWSTMRTSTIRVCTFVHRPVADGRVSKFTFFYTVILAHSMWSTTTTQIIYSSQMFSPIPHIPTHNKYLFPQANTNFISSVFTIILPILIYMLSFHFFSIYTHIWPIAGERPEAMQTGTSTYIANNIMQTILISIIISTYNIFQNYYTSILFSSRIPNEITWQTRAILPKLFGHRITAAAVDAGTSLILNQYKPYEMSMPERW